MVVTMGGHVMTSAAAAVSSSTASISSAGSHLTFNPFLIPGMSHGLLYPHMFLPHGSIMALPGMPPSPSPSPASATAADSSGSPKRKRKKVREEGAVVDGSAVHAGRAGSPHVDNSSSSGSVLARGPADIPVSVSPVTLQTRLLEVGQTGAMVNSNSVVPLEEEEGRRRGAPPLQSQEPSDSHGSKGQDNGGRETPGIEQLPPGGNMVVVSREEEEQGQGQVTERELAAQQQMKEVEEEEEGKDDKLPPESDVREECGGLIREEGEEGGEGGSQ